MKFNSKVRYGIRTMLEIAFCDPEVGIYQKDIASNQNISYKYLDSIISALKKANLIENVGLKKSGYKLTRDPKEINILHIYEAFETRISVVDCVHEDFDCERRKICSVQSFWGNLNTLVSDYFISITLSDLQNQQLELMA